MCRQLQRTRPLEAGDDGFITHGHSLDIVNSFGGLTVGHRTVAREELCQPLGIETFIWGFLIAWKGASHHSRKHHQNLTQRTSTAGDATAGHLRCGRQSARFPPRFDPWWWLGL